MENVALALNVKRVEKENNFNCASEKIFPESHNKLVISGIKSEIISLEKYQRNQHLISWNSCVLSCTKMLAKTEQSASLPSFLQFLPLLLTPANLLATPQKIITHRSI